MQRTVSAADPDALLIFKSALRSFFVPQYPRQHFSAVKYYIYPPLRRIFFEHFQSRFTFDNCKKISINGISDDYENIRFDKFTDLKEISLPYSANDLSGEQLNIIINQLPKDCKYYICGISSES